MRVTIFRFDTFGDEQLWTRGKDLFRGQAQCSTCHQPPTFTDVLSSPDRSVPFLHEPAEVGMDPAYAARSATGKYRTTPLRGTPAARAVLP